MGLFDRIRDKAADHAARRGIARLDHAIGKADVLGDVPDEAIQRMQQNLRDQVDEYNRRHPDRQIGWIQEG